MNIASHPAYKEVLLPAVLVALYAGLAYFTLAGRERTAPGKTLLRFATLNTATELRVAKEQAQLFERRHPDVQVRVEPITDQGILVLTAGGVPPDVFWMCDAQMSDLARGGATLPLDPFAGKDPEFDLSDFFPAMLPLGRHAGRLHALPRENGILVLFYNRDMFEAAGVEVPSGDWTWGDFLAAAKALTRDTDGDGETDQYGYKGNPDWCAEQHSWIWQNGGSIFNEDLSACTIHEPEAVEAIRFFYMDLVKKHKVSPPLGASRGRGIEEFIQGRVAMITGVRPHVPFLRSQSRFNWDVAPLPYQRRRAALTGMSGYAISSMTPHPDLAWTFLKFLVSRDGLTPLVERGFAMPPTRSLARSDLFLKSTPPASNRVFLDASEDGSLRPLPLVLHFQEISSIINRELARAYFDEQTVQEACNRIRRQVDPLLKAHE